MKSGGGKKEKEREKRKEETLPLVHFSLILEDLLEAIKEVRPKQLFFCCGFHTEDEGRPFAQERCSTSQQKEEESDTTTLLASQAD